MISKLGHEFKPIAPFPLCVAILIAFSITTYCLRRDKVWWRSGEALALFYLAAKS